jgi:hypothetical protein
VSEYLKPAADFFVFSFNFFVLPRQFFFCRWFFLWWVLLLLLLLFLVFWDVYESNVVAIVVGMFVNGM